MLAGSVWAREPEVYPQQGVQVFLGLDDTSAPTQVQDGRAQDLQNITLSVSRDMRQRYGYSLVGDLLDIAEESFPPMTGLMYTKFSDGTERIVGTTADRMYYLNSTTWSEVTVEDGDITGGQNNQFVWTIALDEIIGTNDTDTPIQWGGGATEQVSNVSFSGLTYAISSAKVVIWFKNYLIFGNTVENSTEYPTRIRFSNVGTINTWSDDDYIDLGALGGQEINCVGELYDTLIIGLTDSLYKVSLVGGDDVFQVSKITSDIGCVAKNSMQSITLSNAQNGLVFLDKEKRVYFYNGVIAQDISRLITVTMAGLNGSRLQYAVSADTGSDYMLCVTNGTGTTNNLCLDLQYEIGEWTKHTNINANAMASVIDSNTTDQVYFGNYHGMVFQLEDTDLVNDVGTTSPTTVTVDSVSVEDSSTASGLQVIYDSALTLVADELTGAPIELIGGTGSGQTGLLAGNTTTGLIVADALSTTPDATTTLEVGAIDSFYTTKWFDFKDPARLKHFGEIYFWAESDVTSTHSLSYATDYSSDVETLSISMSSSTSDAIWGSAIWGVSLWGDVDDIFRQAKMTTQGRYLRLKWAEDDPNETAHIYGYNMVYWPGDPL